MVSSSSAIIMYVCILASCVQWGMTCIGSQCRGHAEQRSFTSYDQISLKQSNQTIRILSIAYAYIKPTNILECLECVSHQMDITDCTYVCQKTGLTIMYVNLRRDVGFQMDLHLVYL